MIEFPKSPDIYQNVAEEKHKELQELTQLDHDLKDLFEKLTVVTSQIELIRGDYNYKVERYKEAKTKFEELKHYKERVKN